MSEKFENDSPVYALLIDCKSIRTLVLSVFTFRAIVSSIIKV